MKLLLDSAASINDITTWAHVIDGITTNPTVFSNIGGEPRAVIQEIMRLLPEKEIHVEVTHREPNAVYEQAQKIAALGPNICVKIPAHRDYYSVVAQLARQGIKVNITLVFSLFQAVMSAKLGAAYVSPFVGRLEDRDIDGIQLVQDIRLVFDQHGYTTQILAASLRTAHQAHEALLAGADQLTIPASVWKQLTMHPQTDQGIDTFLHDWNTLGITNFP